MKKYIFILFLITIGCSNNKVVYNHGLLAIEAKSDKIEISKTNKNDVLKIFGKPSTISLFDDNLWFYIQRVKKNQSIIKLGNTKITSNKVLEIKFNSYGLVENKKLYLIKDMNELKKVKKITTNEFETTSKLEKLLKSLEQKINSPKTNKKK